MCGYIFVWMHLYHIFIYVPLGYFAGTRDIVRKFAYVLKCGLGEGIRSMVWNKSSIIDTCVIDVGDSPVTDIERWKWCIWSIVIHLIDPTKWSVFASFCLNWNLIRSVKVTSKKLFGRTYIYIIFAKDIIWHTYTCLGKCQVCWIDCHGNHINQQSVQI